MSKLWGILALESNTCGTCLSFRVLRESYTNDINNACLRRRPNQERSQRRQGHKSLGNTKLKHTRSDDKGGLAVSVSQIKTSRTEQLFANASEPRRLYNPSGIPRISEWRTDDSSAKQSRGRASTSVDHQQD